jgi:uncharacterized surface protein with fasciclin (FAS1) repeats
MEEIMKTFSKRASPIAIAIGLALGSASVLAQQQGNQPGGQGAAEPRPAQPAQPRQAQPGQAQPGQAQPGQAQPRPSQPGQGQAQRGNQSQQPGSQSAQGARAANEAGDESDLDKLTEENSDLSQFVEAIKAAGLEDSLTGGTEYTVFAPTNDALEEANIDSLMRPENRAQLLSLIRAHIVADDVDQELASQVRQAQTIDGGSLQISAEGDRIMVGGSEAEEAEIELGNLRVYAVDEVLSTGRAETQASLRRDEQGQQGQARPGQAQPGQARPGQAQPGQAQPNQTRPGQAQPGQAQPGQAQPGQAQPGQSQSPSRSGADSESGADSDRSPAR